MDYLHRVLRQKEITAERGLGKGVSGSGLSLEGRSSCGKVLIFASLFELRGYAYCLENSIEWYASWSPDL